jgi:hypothetical protein
VEYSFEYGNELSVSVNLWENFEYLSDWRLLKKDSASLSIGYPSSCLPVNCVNSNNLHFFLLSQSVQFHCQ